jgi:Ca2+-dependent lipid-binding protein
VSILCGRELIAMDRGGTSDPYVRIMQGEEELHKTVEKKKTVNPVWNDQSNVYIENPFTPLTFQVGFSTWFVFRSTLLVEGF